MAAAAGSLCRRRRRTDGRSQVVPRGRGSREPGASTSHTQPPPFPVAVCPRTAPHRAPGELATAVLPRASPNHGPGQGSEGPREGSAREARPGPAQCSSRGLVNDIRPRRQAGSHRAHSAIPWDTERGHLQPSMKHSRACSYVHPGEQSGFQASQPAGKGHVSDRRRPQPSADTPPTRAGGPATWSESHRPPVNYCGSACGLGQEAALQTHTRRVPGKLPGGGEGPREHTGCRRACPGCFPGPQGSAFTSGQREGLCVYAGLSLALEERKLSPGEAGHGRLHATPSRIFCGL